MIKTDFRGIVQGKKPKAVVETNQSSMFDSPIPTKYPPNTLEIPSKYPANPHFNGSDYIPKLDHKRLTGQLADIKALMIDGTFRTLNEIESATGYPQASISAQLRNLRKERFGGYTVNKQRRALEGLFEYGLDK